MALVDVIEIAAPEIDPAFRGAEALERGAILRFTNWPFPLGNVERAMIAEGLGGQAAKNISYDPNTGMLKGTGAEGAVCAVLTGLMGRYARFAETLAHAVAPGYGAGLTLGRTSFRPVDVAGRATSWRKDDRRRHIDAFPSTPTRGARILRVFLNVDQAGRPRCWRVGPDFEAYASAFLPRVARPVPGLASLQALLRITKSRRTGYDQLMLGLHDAAKRDPDWQAHVPAQDVSFMPGQLWMCFSDQVPHAAVAGRNALEQSFYVDPAVLAAPGQSPLAVLARLTGRDLTRKLF